MDAAIVKGRRTLGPESLYTGCAQGIRAHRWCGAAQRPLSLRPTV